MSTELSDIVSDSIRVAKLSSAKRDALDKKLRAIAIDPLLVSLSLAEVHQLSYSGHGVRIEKLVSHMTLAQLKKASKAWDPHFKIPREITLLDLRRHLEKLIRSEAYPVPKPAPKAKRKAV